jgi:hypothetical protein
LSKKYKYLNHKNLCNCTLVIDILDSLKVKVSTKIPESAGGLISGQTAPM